MSKKLPWIILAVMALWALAGLRAPKDKSGFDTVDFGRLPVLLNGRLQPLDSVARNSLLIMRTRRSVSYEETDAGGKKVRRRLAATPWLMEVMMRPEVADTRPTFRIDNPQLRDLFGLPGDPGKHYFSWNDLAPKVMEFDKEAQRAGKVEGKVRSTFERAAVQLHQGLILYQRLKNSLQTEDTHDFAADLKAFQAAAKPGLKAFAASHGSSDFDQDALRSMAGYLQRYEQVSRMAYPLMIPPADPVKDPTGWRSVGDSLLDPVREIISGVGNGEPAKVPEQIQWQPELGLWAAMSTAYHNNEPAVFNAALSGYRQRLASILPEAVAKGRNEYVYNQWEPFYRSTIVYVLTFLVGCGSWFAWFRPLNRTALLLLWLAFALHTAGMLYRIVLEGRPPVTNLYSSAVFVGWGAVCIGLILESKFRNSIGVVMAAAVGFTTQIIAFNLSESGDTMEMMRAVLDSNFWLTVHVITITIGYSAVFVAGFLAILYIVRGVFTRSLDDATRRSVESMVYGVICFATFFSFVGTVTGGIWADQSWGRFWGWDVKENGALLIVLWCAILLHARWAGLVKGRGLMNLAIGGNIVTAFSWFGVNMLGVGLHSYGFMDAAFKWLMIFIVSQLALIGVGLLPLTSWASFRRIGNAPTRGGGKRAHAGAGA
ncbi:MAG: cytochrome c biogenesis protein CcsA [Verrucomicrobiales bacterium]|nr:cytochrome c biogenesis protein CcsA [Verrucomicrobiales bacterium]